MLLGGISGTQGLDPNSKAAATEQKLQEDLNRFLTLLITQLKNQDPLDPLDATEFTSQLVQFASVEQQIQSNANLEKLLTLQQTSQIADMVNFIDNTIEANGQDFTLENSQAEFTYTLGANAHDVTVSIRDSSGLTVFTADGETDSGKHAIVWDGQSNQGIQMPDGTYTAIVTAKDRAGNLQPVEQTVFGRVTGAGADNGVVTLLMGDVPVLMSDVLAVREKPMENPTGDGGSGP